MILNSINRLLALTVSLIGLIGVAQDTINNNFPSKTYTGPPLSQESKDFAKDFFYENYKFKRLNMVEGTLDDALLKAEQQGKHLFVITSFGNQKRSITDNAFRALDLNKSLNEVDFDDFLFYECNFSDYRNKYLFWAFNSIGFPTGFIFSKEGRLINIIIGADDISNGYTLLGGFTYVQNKPFNNRLNLQGENAINFIDTQLSAFQTLLDPESKTEDYNKAYNAVIDSFNKEQYYFNTFLAEQLSKKLGLKDQELIYALKLKSLETDPYNKQLYYLLIE
ncbi:hypothetical protein [Aestuariibaculum suncheonense]|uniref:Uncharacterized protein n=1 Tax=Aestuariibaculum suncheonense TaxID=1028745 RepID=A0A8J6UGS6_9FLAO|nr:hypothetical protein [Aestuariibaculum suncheonense]MBD0835334.1 hypothetical protein [Aestuariibaculum suncheonense]